MGPRIEQKKLSPRVSRTEDEDEQGDGVEVDHDDDKYNEDFSVQLKVNLDISIRLVPFHIYSVTHRPSLGNDFAKSRSLTGTLSRRLPTSAPMVSPTARFISYKISHQSNRSLQGGL